MSNTIKKGAAGNKKDVDKPDVLPAMRGMNEGNPAASRGLPPGAYDPKKDDSTKELLKTNTPEQTNRKENVHGVGEGEVDDE